MPHGFRIPVEARSERAFPPPLRGRVEMVRHESDVLKGNPLGDPHVRDVAVYLPPSGSTEGKPLLLLLPGYTGAGWLYFPSRSRYLSESFAETYERLIRTQACPEAVVVAPDALTLLGGAGVPLYVAAWLFIPEEEAEQPLAADLIHRHVPA